MGTAMRMTYQNITDAGTRFTKGHSPRHVFVFGAGLSVPASLPPAASLLKRSFAWKSGFKNDINTNLIEAFCDYFYPGIDRTKGNYPDAEDMLGMMEAAQEYDGVRGRGRGYRWRAGYIADARKQLVRLLGEFLWSFQREELFGKIDHIRNIVRAHNSNTVFVTFNYDLLLETALTLEGIEFSYAIDRKNSTRNVVLKPHGSINWFYKSEFSRVRKWQESECASFLDKVFVWEGIYPEFIDRKINPSYILIAPTPHKQIEYDFLKKQWTSFSSSIHSSPNITIVGYSLPAADRLARVVIRRSGSPHNVYRRITVIDPGELENHYRQIVSSRITYVQDYCQNYFT